MSAVRSTTGSLVAVLGFALGLAAVTGCSAPTVERTGSGRSKLLAPQAMFKGAASAETQRLLGIAEWRIYQGKTKYVVTGYSASGRAVKGVSLAFSGASSTSKAALEARLLDGSHFSGTHAYGGATTASTNLTALSQSFATQAVHDLTALRMGLKTSITRSAVHTGEACGGDLVKIAMTSIQCIATASSTGSSVSKQIKIKACVAAAQSASDAVESCKNTGTTTPESSAAKTPAKSTSTDKEAADKTTSKTDQAAADKKQDAEQDKADDKQAAADKKQDAEQDAADAKLEEADKKQDAEQDAADDKQAAADQKQDAEQDAADAKADANAGADATKASEDQTCTSCSGTGADDVQANENTGEVTKADASADTGSGDTGSDTSGDTGGGDTGGDTGGGGETSEA
jgi:hypothetical protein